MDLCFIVFLNCIIPLLFYTLLILKIPYSNCIRLEIKSMNLGYINSITHFKNYNYERNFERGRIRSNFIVEASKVDEIMENLKNLTLLETSELIKRIEETFGVSAQAFPQGPLTLTAKSIDPDEPYKEDEEVVEEQVVRNKKKTHTVIITAIAKENYLNAFRILREYYPDKSAIEIKEVIDHIPHTVKTVNSKKEAEEIVKKLTTEGMTVEIQ